MQQRVTRNAEGDQILFGVITGMAADVCVVYLQIQHGAAPLASISVPA